MRVRNLFVAIPLQIKDVRPAATFLFFGSNDVCIKLVNETSYVILSSGSLGSCPSYTPVTLVDGEFVIGSPQKADNAEAPF